MKENWIKDSGKCSGKGYGKGIGKKKDTGKFYYAGLCKNTYD